MFAELLHEMWRHGSQPVQGFAQDCEQDVLDLGALGLRSRVQQVFCDFEVEGAEVGVDEGGYFADAFVEAVGVVGGEDGGAGAGEVGED